MGLKCGIVGLPNVGKSTLFNSLSSAKAQSANFPFCTIEPNVGTINIPDDRLNKIADLVQPKSLVPNSIEIYDIAGLVEGASKGEGLGNQFLANIRDVNAIIHVVRCFEDGNVAHQDGEEIDPVKDKEIIDTELQLKDLETVEKRLEKAQKDTKSGNKEAKQKAEFLEKLKHHLEQGKSARAMGMTEEQEKEIRDLQLLTMKPILYVANVGEDGINEATEKVEKLRESIQEEGAPLMKVSAKIEAEISELNPEERQDYLEMYGLEEPGVNKMIRYSYDLLNLITFFTAGPEEVRAWPLKKGSTAPEAAGVIHSDFQRGFIKAEVISYEDFIACGSEAAARDAGKLRLEGKQYVVQDGDVIHFKFNV